MISSAPGQLPVVPPPAELAAQTRRHQAEAPYFGLGFAKAALPVEIHERLLEHLRANVERFRPEGEVDVVREEDGKQVPLATLRTGEFFGEISLLHGQPTNASVTASVPSTILFLAREYFQRIVQAVPALAEYFRGLSEERLLDTRMALEGAELEEDESLDIDLHVLV